MAWSDLRCYRWLICCQQCGLILALITGCTESTHRLDDPLDPLPVILDGGPSGSTPLCSPCQTSADCIGNNNFCLLNSKTGERYCGRYCDNTTSCPTGYKCINISAKGIEQCVPESYSCEAIVKPNADGGSTPEPDQTREPQKNPVIPSGPCSQVPMAVGPSAGTPPSVYNGKWTPAPTKGCTFVDGEGRTVVLTDVQHRLLYRTNEVRMLQSALDGVNRPVLEADFCLQEFSQGYAETRPGGHSQMNTHLYRRTDGSGISSGGQWIGENLHMHSGSQYKDRMSSVDGAITGWWNSSGHRENMLNPNWGKGGMGVYVNSSGSTLYGIQTFSRKYANWLWGWEPCSKPPKVNNPDSTVPGKGYEVPQS